MQALMLSALAREVYSVSTNARLLDDHVYSSAAASGIRGPYLSRYHGFCASKSRILSYIVVS